MNIKGTGSPPVNELKSQDSKKSQPSVLTNSAQQTKVNSDGSSLAEKPQGESLSISSQARDIKKVEESLGQLPDINQSRVDELKQAVNNGQYKVDAQKVAENLLRLDSEKDF